MHKRLNRESPLAPGLAGSRQSRSLSGTLVYPVQSARLPPTAARRSGTGDAVNAEDLDLVGIQAPEVDERNDVHGLRELRVGNADVVRPLGLCELPVRATRVVDLPGRGQYIHSERLPRLSP